jgi:hypothetical protein
MYTPSTALVTFPGAIWLLAPAVHLAHLLHLPVQNPNGVVHFPTGWGLIEAASLAISLPALFAADALARRLPVPRGRRVALAGAEAVALWNVVLWWGHPEDALAVGLVLFATVALLEDRTTRTAWLLGLAIAVQPLALLAAGVLVSRTSRRRAFGAAVRIGLPSAVVLALPLAASWNGTVHALVQQPNFPSIDHTTAFTWLAPSIGHQVVSAGPLRLLAVLVAVVGGYQGR